MYLADSGQVTKTYKSRSVYNTVVILRMRVFPTCVRKCVHGSSLSYEDKFERDRLKLKLLFLIKYYYNPNSECSEKN